ncbi:zinc-binding alcohol dehydrogenase family protein [Clavibacter michiganensis]|uniref:zinc-binding alcohol dehydrogenase family protein n=1 Tax=Clavibacter michiganensis TaxID=28447 RepID=UPI001D09B7C3|nr:zinc-binding alcohol dehydrogenase family protein [Clavibacter michiganensis]UDM20684.1 zinc-binding alcohol dehydrogenase family protein [Clavibacter michiganensis subsp. michiganensis]
MPTETAAWLASSAADLTVGPAPRTAPRDGEVAIRVRAVAINPLDTMKQHMGDLMYRWLPHPAVLGEDVAGEVEEVGPGVTRFAVGDRVVAYAVGMEKGRRHAPEGGFQSRVVVRTDLASPIPDAMRFEDAAVLPLGISTAASGLFGAGQLGLRMPDATTPSTGETVVVWGGSTSVGLNAIQLAVAAGYDVVTTASPRNHELLMGLGASRAFDYRSPTVVRDIVAHLAASDRKVAGVLAIGTGSGGPAVDIAIATGATRVSMASPPVSFETLPRGGRVGLPLVRLGIRMGTATPALMIRARARGIRATFIWGSALMHDEVGPMLWERFLPAALAEGRYVAAPAAEVVGTGLEAIQPAMDRLRAGVSARKLVVAL